MKKLIATLAMLATGLINAGPLLPAPEFRAAIKIPDKASGCRVKNLKKSNDPKFF